MKSGVSRRVRTVGGAALVAGLAATMVLLAPAAMADDGHDDGGYSHQDPGHSHDDHGDNGRGNDDHGGNGRGNDDHGGNGRGSDDHGNGRGNDNPTPGGDTGTPGGGDTGTPGGDTGTPVAFPLITIGNGQSTAPTGAAPSGGSTSASPVEAVAASALDAVQSRDTRRSGLLSLSAKVALGSTQDIVTEGAISTRTPKVCEVDGTAVVFIRKGTCVVQATPAGSTATLVSTRVVDGPVKESTATLPVAVDASDLTSTTRTERIATRIVRDVAQGTLSEKDVVTVTAYAPRTRTKAATTSSLKAAQATARKLATDLTRRGVHAHVVTIDAQSSAAAGMTDSGTLVVRVAR